MATEIHPEESHCVEWVSSGIQAKAYKGKKSRNETRSLTLKPYSEATRNMELFLRPPAVTSSEQKKPKLSLA